ncbi:unannotated protein [freshwater metagenome]|uniref:Unannotated protein n=1 Tax=freshwater metagenome TaxID=449393 RepID=A0A6J7IVJ8_9ZZZZ
MPTRVSSTRAGTSDVNELSTGNQPTTSTITFVVPAALKMLTLPPAPSFETTRFGTV